MAGVDGFDAAGAATPTFDDPGQADFAAPDPADAVAADSGGDDGLDA